MKPLRIVHTSDWHLGKKLFKEDRTNEHQFFLNWLASYLIDNSIDALLIAGDIFDSPGPSAQAMKHYYDFLDKVTEHQVAVYIIAGNHDSANMLKSACSILTKRGVHICTELSEHFGDHCTEIWNKEHTISIKLKMLPYFRNYEIFKWIEASQTDVLASDQKIEMITNALRRFFDYWPTENNKPSILMAHHVFGKFLEAGSEQSLSLSGLDSIPTELIKAYDYVALGHIHKKQIINNTPPVIYCGSPIPMRFGESSTKYIAVLNCNKDEINYEWETVPNLKELCIVKCKEIDLFANISQIIKDKGLNEVYLELQIELDSPRPGLIDEIRGLLKDTNIKIISYLPLLKNENDGETLQTSELSKYGLEELFQLFYNQKYPDTTIDLQLKNDFKQLLEDAYRANS